MRTILIGAIMLAGLLAFGCITPPAPQPSAMTCAKYCPTQPHVQCVGTWNISGTYPNCYCQYVCDTKPVQNVSNASNATKLPNPASVNCQNKGYSWKTKTMAAGEAGYCSYGGLECEEWALYKGECCLQDSDCPTKSCASGSAKCTNQACACTAPSQPNTTNVSYPMTTKSVDKIVDDALDDMETYVYSNAPSGQGYVKTTYTWSYYSTNQGNAPNDITLGTGMLPTDVLIDGKSMPGSYALGFHIFQPDTGPSMVPVIKGIMVFLTEKGLSDFYTKSSNFTLTFGPAVPDITLYDCKADKLVMEQDMQGRVLSEYEFSCGSYIKG